PSDHVLRKQELIMKPFAWLGLAIVSGGTVLMYFSERVAVFSMDRMAGLQPGWFGHVHWSLLVGMLLALVGGLVAQFAPTKFRHAQRKREPRRADLVSLVPPLLELGQDVCSPTQSCILSCVGPRSRDLVSAILASEDKAVVSRIASVGNRPPDGPVAPKCKRFA